MKKVETKDREKGGLSNSPKDGGIKERSGPRLGPSNENEHHGDPDPATRRLHGRENVRPKVGSD